MKETDVLSMVLKRKGLREKIMNAKKIFLLANLFLWNLCFSFSQNILDFYNFTKIDSCGGFVDFQNIKCDMSGFYRTENIIDKDYDICMFYDIAIDNRVGKSRILFYPEYAYAGENRQGKIVMNDQAFVFKGIVHMYGTEKFFLLSYFEKNYLIMCADDSSAKAVSHICIFDITDMEHIQFYSLEDCYSRFGDRNPVIGIFRDELCFFASQWMANGEYFMCPFFIKDNALQEMTGDSRKKYRVYFAVSYPGYVLSVNEKTF